MFKLAGSRAPRVAAAAVAAAGATAVQPTAQARAPPQTARTSQPLQGLKSVSDADGWLLTEVNDEVVLFQGYNEREIQDGINMAIQLSGSASPCRSLGAGPLVVEPDEYTDARSEGSASSEGRYADAVIEAASTEYAASVRAEQQRMQDLMAMTSKLLKRPGIQTEIVKGLIEDDEMRQILLRQCGPAHLDEYLEFVGIRTPGLLPAPEGRDASSQQQQHSSPGGRDLLVDKLVHAVAGVLGKAGDALATLGGWLRDRWVDAAGAFSFLAMDGDVDAAKQEQRQQQQEREGGGQGQGGRRRVDTVLGGVMFAAVAVFIIMVARRPLSLRVMRRV